jgi:hypothetical protein
LQPSGFVSQDITSIVVRFKVENSWLAHLERNPGDIVLLSLVNGQWTRVPLELQQDTYVASIPQLTTMVVGVERMVQPEIEVPAPQTNVPRLTEPLTWSWQATVTFIMVCISLIVVLLWGVVSYFQHRGREDIPDARVIPPPFEPPVPPPL